MHALAKKNITAVILAGGQGRRMGGQDKGLIEFNGQPMVEILIEKLKGQGVKIAINANRNLPAYQAYGLPVISDQLGDFQGPLAGFAAAMGAVDTDYILTLPCDGPLLADNFVDFFIEAHSHQQANICVADDGVRLQPVYALIKVDLLQDLLGFLKSGDRKIDRWYAQHSFSKVDFSKQKSMFANINKPEDRAAILEVNKS
ncbi:MAG: molybdenum cofactor guanylyltransferase [Gammaproteobacteria bacterium]|nr:molybdenum cofactor guanylyltransferase [Gammaproteobacteria bacterium]